MGVAGSPEIDTRRLLVSIGLGLGSTEELILKYYDWRERGLRAVSPLAVQMPMPNAPAAAVGLDRKAKAGITSPVMADASGAAAIAEAWRQSSSAMPTSRSVAASSRDRGRARGGVHAAGHDCRPMTMTRPAPAVRSTKIATAWCSGKPAH